MTGQDPGAATCPQLQWHHNQPGNTVRFLDYLIMVDPDCYAKMETGLKSKVPIMTLGPSFDTIISYKKVLEEAQVLMKG